MPEVALNDNQIAQLLATPKRLTSNPFPKGRTKGQHEEWEYSVQAEDGELFVVYARQSSLMKDAFSCGLRWVSPAGDVTLIRANGSNHVHPNRLEGNKIDRKCHLHIATARYAEAGFAAEGFAEECLEYNDLVGALRTLGERCRIEGGPFQAAAQKNLFVDPA